MSERQIASIFVLLLVAQLILLGARVPDDGEAGSPLGRQVLRLLAPFGRLTAGLAERAANVSEGLKQRQTLLEENRSLRDELARLRLERTRLLGLEREVDNLALALGQVRRAPGAMRPATVVYLDQRSWLSTMVLYTGASAEPNQPAVAATGLVGRVVDTAGPYARVQLLADPGAGVGAMLETSRRQGLLRGAGGGRLVLDYVPRQTEVAIGEPVLTAGIDGVYPPGILIGTVAAVEPGSELFFSIAVTPTVDFAALSQVFLLERQAFPEALRAAGP